jgi:hypothetical protein
VARKQNYKDTCSVLHQCPQVNYVKFYICMHVYLHVLERFQDLKGISHEIFSPQFCIKITNLAPQFTIYSKAVPYTNRSRQYILIRISLIDVLSLPHGRSIPRSPVCPLSAPRESFQRRAAPPPGSFIEECVPINTLAYCTSVHVKYGNGLEC